MAIVDKHHGGYSVDCCMELMQSCHIPPRDLQSLRMCLVLAKEHPSHLDREGIEAGAVEAARVNPEVESAKSLIQKANHGLNAFRVKPPGMKKQSLRQ